MTASDPMKEVTRRLQEAVDDPGDVDAMPVGRDAAIAGIADALRARARARRRQRLFRAPAYAAAALVLVGGGALVAYRNHRAIVAPMVQLSDSHDLGRLVEPTGVVTVVRDGRTEAVAQGERVAEGTELRTNGTSEASLDFESGTHVTLGGASRVRLVEQSSRKRFALEGGSFTARVAKLGPDERFVVATPDVEVEVRGTAFRVSLVAGDATCEAGTPTRLEVTEGVVVVRHAGVEARVGAGEHWPSCAVVASSTKPVVREPNAAPAAAKASRMPVSPSPAPETSARTAARNAASSRLAEQNDLFDDAMRKKRAGDTSGALNDLDRLLSGYPSGPLAESAAAERARLLATKP